MATQYNSAVMRVMAQYHTPGALVAVKRPGDARWTLAAGYGDLATRTPIAPDSTFPIRSITKSFTVTALLQLVRDQALALDDKVSQYVSGVPNGDAITLADLAGMQSGIGDYSGSEAFLERFGADLGQPFTEQELVDYGIAVSPVFAPEARYNYSNTNTVLLGMIVEQVTHLPLDQVLATRIFAPLGLAHTAYPYTVPLPDPHPTPYSVDLETGEAEAVPLINPTSLAGAGAMTSTLDDLETWAGALGDGRLIGPDLQALRVQTSRPATDGPEYDRYGLGIGILKGWIGHTGTGIGFQVAAFYDPVTHTTIALMVNQTPDGGRRDLNVAQEMFEALADVVARN